MTLPSTVRSRPTSSTLFPYTTLFRSFRLHLRPHHRRSFRLLRISQEGAGDRRRYDVAHSRLHRSRHLRSEEHTSELQSHHDLVCRLLLEKKNEFYTRDPAMSFPSGSL